MSRLRKEPDQLRMKMLLLGYITDNLEKKNQTLLLVGGQAVETYTAGQFPSGDIDVTTTDASTTEKILRSLGFRQIGMVWLNKRLNVAFHIVGFFPPERSRTIRVGPYNARIISVEELILDRLSAAKFWNIPADIEKAKVLYDNFRKQIDMKYLREMAKKKNIADLFREIDENHKGKRRPSERETLSSIRYHGLSDVAGRGTLTTEQWNRTRKVLKKAHSRRSGRN